MFLLSLMSDNEVETEMLATFWALCEGNPPVVSRFHSQKASNAGFDVALVGLNKLLITQLSCRWFEVSKGTHWRLWAKHIHSLLYIKHQGSSQDLPAGSVSMLSVKDKLVLCSKLLAVEFLFGDLLTILVHWGQDKMAAISQMALSTAFSLMKMYECRLIYHWNLFLRFELTILQHWFW